MIDTVRRCENVIEWVIEEKGDGLVKILRVSWNEGDVRDNAEIRGYVGVVSSAYYGKDVADWEDADKQAVFDLLDDAVHTYFWKKGFANMNNIDSDVIMYKDTGSMWLSKKGTDTFVRCIGFVSPGYHLIVEYTYDIGRSSGLPNMKVSCRAIKSEELTNWNVYEFMTNEDGFRSLADFSEKIRDISAWNKRAFP